MNLNSMLFWYPKIKDLDIPIPKTEIVEIPIQDFMNFMDCKLSLCLKYAKEIKIASEKIGFPLFMRTDLCSGKHDWDKSCYVIIKEEIPQNLYTMVESSFMADLDPSALVFREYIPMASKFTAFWGHLPISPERRYFVRNGLVEEHFPYWVEDAIKNPSVYQWIGETAPTRKWKNLLAEMNFEGTEEIVLLTKQAEKVAKIVDGYWSVDFCKGKDGIWYLIDMGLGEESWHPKGNERFK